MAHGMTELFFALGVGILAVALLFTPIMDSVAGDATSNLELDNATAQNVTDRLELEATQINQTNSTVTLEDLTDFNTTSGTLNVSESRTFDLSNDNITVELTSIVTNNTTAQYSVTYPPTFGYNQYVATFMNNLDTIIAALGFLLIGGVFISILE